MFAKMIFYNQFYMAHEVKLQWNFLNSDTHIKCCSYRYINAMCTNNYKKSVYMEKSSLVLSLHGFINWYILRTHDYGFPAKQIWARGEVYGNWCRTFCTSHNSEFKNIITTSSESTATVLFVCLCFDWNWFYR